MVYGNLVKHALCVHILKKGGISIWYYGPYLTFISDEARKEKIIIYGQDYEQAQIGSEESSRNEEFNAGQSGPSSYWGFP